MSKRILIAAAVGLVVLFAGLTFRKSSSEVQSGFVRIAEVNAATIYHSEKSPTAYLIAIDGHGVLIDAPEGLPEPPPGVAIELVLLTHHHRDSVAGVQKFLEAKVPVRASKPTIEGKNPPQEWLSTTGVRKFWAESIPLRSSRTAYFVVGSGFEGIDQSLTHDEAIDFHGLKIEVIATPGHSRDHLAFALGNLQFVGDAITGDGKLWTPFTTDWDHWTDAGLKPTADSLRKLAAKTPKAVYPARGRAIINNPSEVLENTAKLVDEAGFLKSFERYTNRLGNPPQYDFLVSKDHVESIGDKPWARISEHLWITGNTYVLTSKTDKACFVLDPFGKNLAAQLDKLRNEEKLGPIEVVAFSHAHYDHYDGVHVIPGEKKYKVWALDMVAQPLEDPFRFRAPFLDPRPIQFDGKFRSNETSTWREYTFKWHHLPGQTWFTAGLECMIDGKKCMFTADNFFHQKQFSGSGGWMGLNRSMPTYYSMSAKKVLDVRPDWVLAEHGGPYVFNAEDYERRVKWGNEADLAAKKLCPHGSVFMDWFPNYVQVSPVLTRARAGDKVGITVGINADIDRSEPLDNSNHYSHRILICGNGFSQLFAFNYFVENEPGQHHERQISITVPNDLKPGRYVFDVIVRKRTGEISDAFFAVDVIAK